MPNNTNRKPIEAGQRVIAKVGLYGRETEAIIFAVMQSEVMVRFACAYSPSGTTLEVIRKSQVTAI